MNKKKFSNSKLFGKIIVSFSIIIIIPILTILFYYYPSSKQEVQKIINTEITAEADRILTYTDSEVTSLFKIAATLEANNTVESLSTINTYTRTQAFTNLIKSQKSQSDLIDNIFIFNTINDKIFSDVGTLDNTFFGSKSYKFDNISQDELLTLLKKNKKPFILPFDSVTVNEFRNATEPKVDTICFGFPSRTGRSCILFYLNAQKLEDMLTSLISPGRDYVFSHDNTIVSTSIRDVQTKKIFDRLNNLDDNFTSYSLENQYLNLYTHIIFDTSDLNSRLMNLQLLTIGIIFLFIILSSVIVLQFIKKNYKPLISLLDNIFSDKTITLPDIDNTSEFDIIKSIIDNMKQTNLSLTSKIDNQSVHFKNTLLYQILSNNIMTINNITDIEENLKIDINERYIFCGFINIVSVKDNIELLETINKLNATFKNDSKNIQIVFSPYFENNSVFFLISCINNNIEEARHFLDTSLIKNPTLCSVLHKCNIIISNSSNSFFEINSILKLSINALEYLIQYLGDYNHVFTCNEIINKIPQISDYPIELVNSLNDSFSSLDMVAFKSVINTIVDRIKTSSYTTARILFSQSIYIILQHKDYDLQGIKNLYNNIDRCTIDEMVDILNMNTTSIIKKLDLHHVEDKSNIIDYINTHFLENSFSIVSLADKYNMQVSNMSLYFKKKQGVTFQDYMSTLKIKKAQELLTNTDMKLEEISEYLNYSNSSSFGRAFKKIMDMTPGEFRTKMFHIVN